MVDNGQTLKKKTIEDFGEQWKSFQDNEGYYGSVELFKDLFYPIFDAGSVRDKNVADIGSGTGRIVKMLLALGARHVTAVEPSKAFEVLLHNLSVEDRKKVTAINATGEHLPEAGDFDFVFSCGVLHHIPDPLPVVKAAHAALKPGGKLNVWLYSREGNGLYLLIFGPLRKLTTRLSHNHLVIFVRFLDLVVVTYGKVCNVLKLPMYQYFRNHLNKFSPDKRRLVIYDQLNPSYAKYYTRAEALDLFGKGGFSNVTIHHRHSYGWTVSGTKE